MLVPLMISIIRVGHVRRFRTDSHVISIVPSFPISLFSLFSSRDSTVGTR